MSDGSRKKASKPRAKATRRKPAASKNPWVLPSESTRKRAASPTAAKPRRRSGEPRRRGQGVDVNGATFEQLREAGLSIGQSARLIERRRLHGAFRSIDELAKLRGFSRRMLGDLQGKLQIDG
jgi:DNA uptake protein ComE-like DNA-binding protein